MPMDIAARSFVWPCTAMGGPAEKEKEEEEEEGTDTGTGVSAGGVILVGPVEDEGYAKYGRVWVWHGFGIGPGTNCRGYILILIST